MIQPQIAINLFSDRELIDQGFLSRVLLSAPKSRIGARTFRKLNDATNEHLISYQKKLKAILDQSYKASSTGVTKNKSLILTPEAEELYIEYINKVEKLMNKNELYDGIRGFANKLPEHAARLAATLALYENYDADKLELEHLQSGIALADYYAIQMLSFVDEYSIDPDIMLAERLLDWLHNSWSDDVISLPDIYQLSIHKLKTKSVAARIVNILLEHHWLEVIEPMVVKDKYRKEVFRIIRHKTRK